MRSTEKQDAASLHAGMIRRTRRPILRPTALPRPLPRFRSLLATPNVRLFIQSAACSFTFMMAFTG
jgi:hypothetical protein